MVQHPKDYPWSSFRAYLGQEDPLISKEFILGYFERRGLRPEEGYCQFVEEAMDKPPEFTELGLRKIRILGESITRQSPTLAPKPR